MRRWILFQEQREIASQSLFGLAHELFLRLSLKFFLCPGQFHLLLFQQLPTIPPVHNLRKKRGRTAASKGHPVDQNAPQQQLESTLPCSAASELSPLPGEGVWQDDAPHGMPPDPRAKSREWDATRRRWKRRKYDLRGEADVGHVVWQQQRRRVTRRSTKEERVETKDWNVEDDDDRFVLYEDDQAKVLRTLQRASSLVVPEVPSSAPILEHMEPWERGVAPPRETSRRRRSTPATQVQSPTTRDPRHSDPRYTRRAWSTAVPGRRPTHLAQHLTAQWPLYHDAPRPHSGADGLTSRTSLLPRRQLLRAIARHLIGNGGVEDTVTHNTAMTTLWKLCGTEETVPRLPLSTQAILLEELSRRNGADALSSSWSSRVVPSLLAPERDVGYNLLSERRAAPIATHKTTRSSLLMVTPETTYVHIPGTVPPALSPLSEDPSALNRSFVYGPVDRFAQVLHSSGRIDPVISTLSLASIIQQMAAVKDPSLRPHFHAQLTSILRTMLRYNQNNVYKRLVQKFRNPDLEVPLAFFYRTVMQYCAMVVAGLIPLGAEKTRWRRTIQRDEGHLAPMIDHLWDFLEEHIKHNGLQLFSRLHILHGLLRIGKMLPESGIAILGQPLDHSRTPIAVVRELLEHLEESRSLSETQPTYDDRTVVNVGELEYAFFRASETFAQCTQRETTSVEYHGWYLGALASSLLLCSGLFIGKSRSSGEPRRPLPKFREMRRETARAFRALAYLSQQQPSQCVHKTMVSFLEWSQVLGLLIGCTDDTEPCVSIRALHQYHSTQWIFQENTQAALSSASVLSGSCDSPDLEVLARSLEVNPSDIGRWRSFVAALGPLDISESSVRRSDQWWGNDRCDWWDTCLLPPMLNDAPVEKKKRHKPPSTSNGGDPSNDSDEIYPTMVRHLKNIEPVQQKSTSLSSNEEADRNPSLNVDGQSLRWLDDLVLSLETDVIVDPSLSIENSKDFHLFPTNEIKNSTGESPRDQWELPSNLSGNDVRQYEMIGYKVWILCHLYSAAHSSVHRHVQHLFRSAKATWFKYQKDGRHPKPPDLNTYLAADPESIATLDNQLLEVRSRNAWQTLRWLYRMGLDVTQIEL